MSWTTAVRSSSASSPTSHKQISAYPSYFHFAFCALWKFISSQASVGSRKQALTGWNLPKVAVSHRKKQFLLAEDDVKPMGAQILLFKAKTLLLLGCMHC